MKALKSSFNAPKRNQSFIANAAEKSSSLFQEESQKDFAPIHAERKHGERGKRKIQVFIWNLCARNVVASSKLLNIKKLGSALRNASEKTKVEDGGLKMENNIILYTNEMAIVKEMLNQGIIDKDDYLKAEAYLAKKHCIKDKSIYRLNKLITEPENVINIGEEKEEKNGQNNDNRTVKKVTQIT